MFYNKNITEFEKKTMGYNQKITEIENKSTRNRACFVACESSQVENAQASACSQETAGVSAELLKAFVRFLWVLQTEKRTIKGGRTWRLFLLKSKKSFAEIEKAGLSKSLAISLAIRFGFEIPDEIFR